MKKIFHRLFVLATALFLVSTFAYAQQQSPQDQGGWTCPGMKFCGMRQHGQHGVGMRNCGLGLGRMMHQNQGKPLTKEQASQVFERYVQLKNNPNLKLGELTETGDVFEVTITTKDGSLVEKMQLNKNTGWFRNV